MKKEQLCQLQVQCLGLLTRHSSYNTAVLGARVPRGAENQVLYVRGEVAVGTGGCWERGGTVALLQVSDGKGREPQLGEVSAARQLEVLDAEKCLLL